MSPLHEIESLDFKIVQGCFTNLMKKTLLRALVKRTIFQSRDNIVNNDKVANLYKTFYN